jgi:hypothetical protein
MKLDNETPLPAKLYATTSARSDEHMLACVIARPTYRLRGGELVPTPDEPWPISQEPTDTPLGQMPGDKPFYMGGVDVLVGGAVRQPGGVPRPRLDVELAVGRTFRRRIAVFGERRWVRGGEGKLVKSEPEPFVLMDLRYERAFGGEAKTEYGPMPFMANQLGQGFYLDEQSALGKPLPNLEDPNALVESLADQPEPVGLGYYPTSGALRARTVADHPGAKAAVMSPGKRRPGPPNVDPAMFEPIRSNQILPTFFNTAHPKMVIPADKAPKRGDLVHLSHGVREGDLAFVMPALAAHVHVQLEEREYVFPLYLDQIGLVAGEGRVFFSLRCVFEYRVAPRERRRATLHLGAVPDPIPPEYRVAWKDGWDKGWWDEG